MVTHVPARHVSTLYSRVGDLLAWVCLAGLAALAALAVVTSSPPKYGPEA
jgi:apolipoprotein N-acyltransferase